MRGREGEILLEGAPLRVARLAAKSSSTCAAALS
jgi:hypothetical protein